MATKLEEKCRELEMANTSLNESNERYHAMFKNTPAVMLLIDPDTARIVDANPAAVSFYGYLREEMLRMFITDLSNNPADEVMKILAEAKEEPQHVERRHRLKYGELRDVEIYRGPIVVGNRCYIFSIIHDITARKEAEEAYRESEYRLRAIAETATDAIILIDDRMRVIYWNRSAERMFGYPSEESIDKEIGFIVPDRYRKAHAKGFGQFVENGEGPLLGTTHETTAIRKGGVEFPVEVSISGIKLKGKWHAAGIIKDISKRKSLESQFRQAQKMEALGTLTGGIAHDFNNVLTAIIGFATLLQLKLAADNPFISYVNNILSATDRAANLIQSLLAFSKKQAVELKSVDLNDVVAGVQKILAQLIREDVDLAVATTGHPLPVMADRGQLDQILMNFTTNARDALPKGGAITISTSSIDLDQEFVRVRGYGMSGRYALLAFSDNGCGMDEKTRQRIFEPFFTTKEVGKGTGLGLATTYGIVKQHNGFIDCCSEPGKGATFRIYLPLTESVKEQAGETAQSVMVGGTETILLAEDDEMVRTFVSSILQQFGYRVIEAVDGEDALTKFRERLNAIQLVMLDVIMPKKNGRQVYEEMRNLSPDISVIFTSGYPAEVFRQDELLEEELNFISKPVSPHKLLSKVREVLDTQ